MNPMDASSVVVGRVLPNVSSVPYLLPELFLIFGVLGIITWDLIAPKPVRFRGVVVIALAALAASFGYSVFFLVRHFPELSLFGGQLAFDRYANVFRALFALIT